MDSTVRQVLKTILDETPIYIYGCGQRGRKVANCLQEIGANVKGFIDRNPRSDGTEVEGIPCNLWKDDVVDGVIIVTPKQDADSVYEKLVNEGNQVLPLEAVEIINCMTYLNAFQHGYSFLFPLTHFYSPYPDINWCRGYEKKHSASLADVDLNDEKQKDLLTKMHQFYSDLPDWNKDSKLRYSFPNTQYGMEDALIQHCMLRLIRPHRLIEIGSGYSSAVTLDTNEYYLDHSIELQFIEPYPERLKKILKEDDHIVLQECFLQDADFSRFRELESGDVLFVDSTHVAKRDSDVNIILFEILPQLNQGVYIHFHDVFAGFEYPMNWAETGRVWNEDYMLHAFLMNNHDYEILFFNSYMKKEIEADFPYEFPNPGGGLWLRKKE